LRKEISSQQLSLGTSHSGHTRFESQGVKHLRVHSKWTNLTRNRTPDHLEISTTFRHNRMSTL
jgi:hypothetical protein